MFSSPSQSSSWYLDNPEIICLENTVIERARMYCVRTGDESNEWQFYISLLGSLAFEDWLKDRMPNRTVGNAWLRGDSSTLEVDRWKIIVISTEEVVSEGVKIGKRLLDSPELAGQIYVLLEVDEEDESVVIHGIQRRDVLREKAVDQGDHFWLHLDSFEPEPNRLLQYIKHLDIASIPMPQSSAATESNTESARARLSQWLQGALQEGWEAIESLAAPQTTAFAVRGLADGARRGKLIDLGVQLGATTVALVVGVAPAAEEKVSISVQLLPTGGDRTLPPELTLTHLSKAGKVLQSVTTRIQDNFIQLKSFKGKPGQKFSLRLSLEDWQLTEEFEI